MIIVNDNYRKLPQSYLFSEVGRRVATFRQDKSVTDIIRMDIGDVTRPLFPCVIRAMREAVDNLACKETFHGYGPEQGYDFLRNAIAENDYQNRGMAIDADDIFISDGAKSDIGNLGDIYSRRCKVAVMDPSYPVYVDDSVIDGRGGDLLENNRWSNIIYMNGDSQNKFIPGLPSERPDVIFLCFPNNPTGESIRREELKKWVEYAIENSSLIIYDSAYEAYVRHADAVRSIYEIEGATKVAIEVRSFSKTAGFTGLRCGYTVVPKELMGQFSDGTVVALRNLWNRRQTTKFNGASYVAQCGAAAIYSDEGKRDVKEATDYYMSNARLIRDSLIRAGFDAYGGEDSPYVWATDGSCRTSWEIFDELLKECGVSTTPGSGFGSCGEGYIRLTGFNSKENTEKAMAYVMNYFERKQR